MEPNQLTAVRARQALSNASFAGGTSGALGEGDRGAWASVPSYTGNPHDSNDYVFRWRQYVHLYEISWEARKIIRIPVEDALRKAWVAEGIPEEMSTKIEQRLNRMNFRHVLTRSLMLERLLGGCLSFMGLDSNEDDPSKPYKPTEGSRLRFCNAVPISRITRMTWDNNPLSEGYMRPERYLINGQSVHVSRCLVWDGEPLFDPYDYALTNFRSNLAGFGPSKLAPIWDDIVKAVGTRQAAYQLIQTNNAIIAAISGLQDLGSTSPGKATLDKLKQIVNTLSVYRAAVVDGDRVDIKQSAASFGSVPELIITFIQILSAASDIPATRFIGQAPGGLNTTGESDLENYYNVIDSFQTQRIEPALRRTYDIVGYEMFKERWTAAREKLTFKFPPLWNLTELEEAERASKIIDNVMKARDAGLISDEKIIEELNLKGAFSVDLDESDIQTVDDTGLGGLEGEQPPAPNPQEEIGKIKQFPFKNADSVSMLIAAAGANPQSIDRAQFLKGYSVEMEHADTVGGDKVTIAKIVLDHLAEDVRYYDKLEKVENGLFGPRIPHKNIELEGGQYGRNCRWIDFDTGEVSVVYDTPGQAEQMKRQNRIEWTGKDERGTPMPVENMGAFRKTVYDLNMIAQGLHNPKTTVHMDQTAVSSTSNPNKILIFEEGGSVKRFHDNREAYEYLCKRLDKEVKEIMSYRNALYLERLPGATDPQKSAGNYKKHHIKVHGLDISIENPMGSERQGKDKDGNTWASILPAHYGYVRRTEGADGDHVDVYVGPHESSEQVYIVDQLDADTKDFDEHKCIFGCLAMTQAKELYVRGFSDGRGEHRIGAITEVPIKDFKRWLKEGDTTKPFQNEKDFDESKHSRADDGKFGSGGGSSAEDKGKDVQEIKKAGRQEYEDKLKQLRKQGTPVKTDLTVGELGTLIPLDRLDEKKVAAVKEAIKDGSISEHPIIVGYDEKGKKLEVKDGHHRLKALLELYGKEHEVPVVMLESDFRKRFSNSINFEFVK